MHKSIGSMHSCTIRLSHQEIIKTDFDIAIFKKTKTKPILEKYRGNKWKPHTA